MKPLSAIFDVPIVSIISNTSSTAHLKGRACGTTKQVRSEGMQSVKWKNYNEKNWEDSSQSEEPPEPEAESDDAQLNGGFRVLGEDNILEG